MTTGFSLTHTATSSDRDQNSIGARRAPTIDQDFYAAWKAIFEASRATDASADPAPSASASWIPSRQSAGGGRTSDAAPAMAEDGRVAHTDAVNGPAVLRSPVDSASWSEAAPYSARQSDGARTDSAPQRFKEWRPSLAVAVLQRPPPMERLGQAAEAGGTQLLRPIPDSNATAQETAARESVNVFFRGTAVAIVVRDGTISQHQALCCAFQTARELTGEGAALEQLILNGRVLYRQHDAARAQLMRQDPAWLLAC
jgi:hypothetical protein